MSLCFDWGSVSEFMGASRPLVWEEGAGRGHCHSFISITHHLNWAGLGPRECACGTSSRRILEIPTSLFWHVWSCQRTIIGRALKVQPVFWNLQRGFFCWSEAHVQFWKKSTWGLQKACSFWAWNIFILVSEGWSNCLSLLQFVNHHKHYRSWSRPKSPPVRLASVVPKLRDSINSGKGLPEPDSCDGHGSLRSFSLWESNNLEVSWGRWNS